MARKKVSLLQCDRFQTDNFVLPSRYTFAMCHVCKPLKSRISSWVMQFYQCQKRTWSCNVTRLSEVIFVYCYGNIKAAYVQILEFHFSQSLLYLAINRLAINQFRCQTFELNLCHKFYGTQKLAHKSIGDNNLLLFMGTCSKVFCRSGINRFYRTFQVSLMKYRN